ncbi:hypothetical protein [Halomonas sp. LBP4]|uniref:hypothetical protein n=1 Tax=Halomonas sp. LBP4 TaxID=2044917 RepID=UPI000D757087|nr:hypothetical protein [Halomonas sp. LBP4]PXX94998.1 hypothetical protein CR157_20505 [Halomonas sp. LBP4]
MLGIFQKTSKPASEWAAWLTRRRDIQSETASLADSVKKAARHAERTATKAMAIASRVSDLAGVDAGSQPSKEICAKVRDELRKKVDFHDRRGKPQNAHQQREALEEMEEALRESQRADEALATKRAASERLEEQREAHAEAQPEATQQALSALSKELEQLEGESSRVTATIERLSGGGDPAAAARREADDAQTALDEIEAAAAMGDGDEGDQRAAAAALTKARSKAEKAREEGERRIAATRGLERTLTALEEKIADLEATKLEISARVYAREVEEHEKRLIDLLEGKELEAVMEQLRRSRLAWEGAMSAINGGPRSHPDMRLEMTLPSLLFHPERKRLDGTLTI